MSAHYKQPVLRADEHGLCGVRLRGERLEVVEGLRGRVGRGRPEDAHAREGEREEDKLGLDGLGQDWAALDALSERGSGVCLGGSLSDFVWDLTSETA